MWTQGFLDLSIFIEKFARTWKKNRLSRPNQEIPSFIQNHREPVLTGTDFLLNCFVLGDDEDKVFTVEIAKDKNVGILKKFIKAENPHALNRVDAKDLDLWKVCRPLDNPASKKPRAGPPLIINKRLSSLWDGDPSDDDLHILVKAPPGTF